MSASNRAAVESPFYGPPSSSENRGTQAAAMFKPGKSERLPALIPPTYGRIGESVSYRMNGDDQEQNMQDMCSDMAEMRGLSRDAVKPVLVACDPKAKPERTPPQTIKPSYTKDVATVSKADRVQFVQGLFA